MANILPLSSYQPSSGSVVAISGCFDILHIGHIRFITAARKRGDRLVVLLESDEFIRYFKKREPFHSQEERAEILSHISDVDTIVLLPFMGETSKYQNMWESIRPNIIALTAGDTYLEDKKEQASLIGAQIMEVTPLIDNKSSTIALTHKPDKEVLD
jgi:cytidyltransferase-like protein